jgi:hypothetical protein
MEQLGQYGDQVLAWLAWLWAFPQAKIMLTHIGVNLVVAVAATLYTKTFILAKFGEFLYRKVLPYLLVFAFCAAFGQAAGLEWLGTAAWVGLEAMLVGDLTDNLRKLGLPIPDLLTKRDQ